MISRRTFIKRSAQAAIAASAAEPLSALFASGKNEVLASQELKIPPVINGGNLTLSQTTYNIFDSIDTNVLAINNISVGPTIKVKKGDTFKATVHNNLAEDSVLHWHGIHAPALMSGHPRSMVAPGVSYSVEFPIIQRACTSFYHAHPDMNTAKQVYMGLAGLFIVEDDEEKALGLPSGEYDIPLIIQDRRFDNNKQLVYAPTEQDKLSGWLGDTILTNGTPNAYLAIAPTLYRFRIVNGSNARFYKIGLSDGKTYTAIGNDGGFIEAPLTLTEALIGSGERIDILIDFSSYKQGDVVTLKSLKFTMSDGPGTGTIPQGSEMNLLEFRISKTGTSGGVIPSKLPTLEIYNPAEATEFLPQWDFAALHHINEMPYDINAIVATAPFGKLLKWTLESEAANTHPVHIHGAFFQVLDRNGVPPDPLDRGWKDTVKLNPLEKDLHLLIKFSEYTGLFLIHCHKLEHSDAGMMANFAVTNDGAVKELSKDSTIACYPNPASNNTTIRFPALKEAAQLRLIDLNGRIIQTEMLRVGSSELTMNLNAVSTGNYLIDIAGHTASLIVQR
jgi:blue copper oxidase